MVMSMQEWMEFVLIKVFSAFYHDIQVFRNNEIIAEREISNGQFKVHRRSQ